MKNRELEPKTTKYFGIVVPTCYVSGNVNFEATINGHSVIISISNYNRMENKINICWEIIDKYIEFAEIAKKAIIESLFRQKGTACHYFKTIFQEYLNDEQRIVWFSEVNFDELNIIKFIEENNYPDLSFDIEDGILFISLEYMDTGFIPSLIVKMDKELNIIDFEIDYGS